MGPQGYSPDQCPIALEEELPVDFKLKILGNTAELPAGQKCFDVALDYTFQEIQKFQKIIRDAKFPLIPINPYPNEKITFSLYAGESQLLGVQSTSIHRFNTYASLGWKKYVQR